MTSIDPQDQPQTTITDAGIKYETVSPEDVKGQHNDRDLAYALRQYSKVITENATDADQVAARFAQAVAGPGREGRKAYYASLTETATDETRAAAQDAFTASLAKSDEMRAARHTESNRKRAIQNALYASDNPATGNEEDFCTAQGEED